MSENVDNIVLEQLRLIREDFRRMDQRFDALEARMVREFDEVRTDLGGQTMMIHALANVMGLMDRRVKHLEEKLGAAE